MKGKVIYFFYFFPFFLASLNYVSSRNQNPPIPLNETLNENQNESQHGNQKNQDVDVLETLTKNITTDEFNSFNNSDEKEQKGKETMKIYKGESEAKEETNEEPEKKEKFLENVDSVLKHNSNVFLGKNAKGVSTEVIASDVNSTDGTVTSPSVKLSKGVDEVPASAGPADKQVRQDNPGNDNAGNDNPGNDNPGNDNTDKDNPGNDNPGNDNTDKDNPGEKGDTEGKPEESSLTVPDQSPPIQPQDSTSETLDSAALRNNQIEGNGPRSTVSREPQVRHADPTAATVNSAPSPNGGIEISNGSTSTHNSTINTIKHLDRLYDEILAGTEMTQRVRYSHRMSERNHNSSNNINTKYEQFKKEFNEYIMNEKEYEMMKNLIDTVFSKGKVGTEKKNALHELFKNALENDNFKEQFKNVMYGIYSFTKRHSYLRGDVTTNNEFYDKFYDNAVSLLDTLLIK
ncbi:MSP7-like protein [Plasmodium brasilianum]|uniref:MSP7-like protein n=1 Tax=Plasmodium brasilianum TaxID=5824 RepID=A0ACB9Y5X4_PLABR|nr:MSP7-like protein [Plasmodium brasilianum]